METKNVSLPDGEGERERAVINIFFFIQGNE